MLFLVQSNIYSDPDHDRIFEVLQDLNIPFEKIHLDSSMQTIAIQQDRKDIFVYGSVRLARLAKANTDWYPGSFYGGNHLFEVCDREYGHHLLNHGIDVFKFGEAIQWLPDEQKFIKPYKEAKIFTGTIFTELKWNNFVQQSMESPRTPRLHRESLVQASTPQKIIKEARLWIVGGQIIDAVYYHFHGDVLFERTVNAEGIDFAKARIKEFEVAPAFVMDICLTTNGWKIVEINCINSAGFYPTSNVASVIKALNIYFSR